MRAWLFLLNILLLASPVAAVYGEEELDPEVVLGRVESVNHETGEVTVSVLRGADETGEPETMTVQMDPGAIPGGVRPGVMVRAWGGIPDRALTPPVFSAVRMHLVGGPGPLRSGDPTGVRHRLGLRRRMGPGMGPPGGRR